MINVAVVGAGFMGSLHARCAARDPRANLAGIVDTNEDSGRALAKRLDTKYLGTVDEALKEDIDAFIVALPDRLHVETSVKLLRNGRSVLLEKPMADTLDGARAIAEAASEGGGRLMIGHILRFDPRYAMAAEAVRRGDIGEVVHVSAGRLGTQSIGLKLNGSSSVCFYIGVHDVDAVQWITGKRIERVYSRAVSKIMPSHGVDSEDAIFSTVDLAGGAIGHLFFGWSRPDTGPFSIDGRFEIVGTKGTLEVDVRDHGLRIFGPDGYKIPDGQHWPEVYGELNGDLQAEVGHFLESLESGEPFTMSVNDALRAVAVNDAILRSVESGQPETVTEV
jgi:predicted dehydrogenase